MANFTGTIFDDEIFGTNDNDTISGLAGNDDLYGGLGNDTILGGDGADILDGDFGNDILTGGSGSDDFRPGLGLDTITDFTPGVDLINLYNVGVTSFTQLMSFATQVGGNVVIAPTIDEFQLFRLTINNITLAQLSASNFNFAGPSGATISGTEGADLLYGLGGDFVITHAWGGNDTILSGPTGADRRINAGSGDDTVIITDPVSSGILMGESGFDTLILRPRGANTISGNVYNFTSFVARPFGTEIRGFEALKLESVAGTVYNVAIDLVAFDLTIATVTGGAGTDTITSRAFSNSLPTVTLLNWSEDDTIIFDMSSLFGGNLTVPGVHPGLYRIIGSFQADVLTGSDSRESLDGGSGDDTLDGKGGIDTLNGGDGDDTITGGGGDDAIDGGAGSADEARFSGNRADYLVEKLVIDGVNHVRVTGQGALAGDGVDLLRGIEFLKFADQRISVANNRPALGAPPMPDQSAGDGLAYSYQIPLGAFTDADGDALTYSASLADGSALPAWLGFNPATRTFSGTPPEAAIGTVLQVRVTATDNAPGDPGSQVSDVFALAITQSPGQDIIGTPGTDSLAGTFRPERMFGLDSDDTLTGSAGADQLDGGNGTDFADYSSSASAVTVNLTANTGQGGDAEGDSYASIEGIRGSSQNDTLTGSAGANTLIGNGGFDSLAGGAGADSLDGGEGNDKLFGGALSGSFSAPHNGNPWTAPTLDTGADVDTLNGGNGNDLLFAGYGDNVDGGAGSDALLISFQGAGTGVTADFGLATLSIGGGTITNFETVDWVEGSNFDDVITMSGSSATSVTFAPVFGMGGNDTLIAGYLTGTMYGGNGNDTVDGRGSQYLQLVDGGDGDDTLYTNANTFAQAFGGNGNDTIYAHGTIFGDAGDDTIYLQFSYYRGAVHGGTGSDTIYAVAYQGHSSIFGDEDNDALIGGSDADTLDGGTGDDTITSGGGLNLLLGGAGNDRIVVAASDNGTNVQGGADFDTLEVSGSFALGAASSGLEKLSLIAGTFNVSSILLASAFASNAQLSGTGAIVVTLNPGTSFDGSGYLVLPASNLTLTVNGTASDETLTAVNGAVNVLNGADGADTLNGGSGNDILDGGAGVNAMFGNGGNDRLVVDGTGAGTSVNGGTGTDTLAVSGTLTLGTVAGIEAIEMTGAALTLTGTQISSGFALTTAVSGTGSLTINMTAGQLLGTKFWTIAPGIAVTINGTSGVDVLKLGNTNQTVSGGDGTDQIKGGSAVDTIDGGAGIDKIMGLGGADVLTGGAGNDVFRYLAQSDSGLGAAADRITDFAIGQDRLNFVQIDADAATVGDQAFAFIGTAAFANTGTGQIRYLTSGSDLIVQADVNGDGTADMEIFLQGLAGQSLSGTDFVL